MVCMGDRVDNRFVVVGEGKWVIGITRFAKTLWTKGHGTFGAHKEGGLLGAQAPLSKNYLLL